MLVIEPVLREQGFTVQELYPTSTCMVHRVSREGVEYISKSARVLSREALSQVVREHETLKVLDGVRGVPRLTAWCPAALAPRISLILNALAKRNFMRDRIAFLVREYVEGEERRPETTLNAGQAETMKVVVEKCHDAGFARLGIGNPRNLIVDSQGAIHYIDYGLLVSSGEVTPDEFVRLKREDREKLLNLCGG